MEPVPTRPSKAFHSGKSRRPLRRSDALSMFPTGISTRRSLDGTDMIGQVYDYHAPYWCVRYPDAIQTITGKICREEEWSSLFGERRRFRDEAALRKENLPVQGRKGPKEGGQHGAGHPYLPAAVVLNAVSIGVIFMHSFLVWSGGGSTTPSTIGHGNRRWGQRVLGMVMYLADVPR